jgi:hypothetical protein
MRIKILSLLISCSATAYGQIPVTDVAANTTNITNQVLNASTWGHQLLELEQQSSSLTKTLQFVTNVSNAVRDAAYAKQLIERQTTIVDGCKRMITRSQKLDVKLAQNIERSVSDILSTNVSLVTLINSTLTSKFKMNDAERLRMLMDIKKEQQELIEQLRTTDLIISTATATEEIMNLQLFK